MKKIAVFDFDDTLILGDSEIPYMIFASSAFSFYAAIAEGVARYKLLSLWNKPKDSMRTFIKGFVLRRVLKGKKISDLDEAVRKTLAWMKINEPIMQKLREHHASGDTIVIASGSLSLYLPQLLRDVPHDALICTDVGVENGIVTGEITSNNCVRKGKAARVKAWMDAHGPFDDSFGYGNAPHDLPMLELMRHRMVI